MDKQLNFFDQGKMSEKEPLLAKDFFQLNKMLENEALAINYGFGNCQFGNLIEASTAEGICYLAFYEKKDQAIIDLKKRFPKAEFILNEKNEALKSLLYFTKDWGQIAPLNLYIKGTDFQLNVWEALLEIPMGQTTTYKDIANQIGNSKANRAVGTAAGKNPIAFLIPCHRLLQTSGKIGGYRWGESRKLALLNWESA